MKKDTQMTLRFSLRSAATFGRGEGLPGLVDQEIEQDEQGLPALRGRTLKGLLAEEAESILYAVQQQDRLIAENLKKAKERLFGKAGSSLQEQGILHVGDARLPAPLRTLFEAELRKGKDGAFSHDQLADALTGIRRQTAMNEYGGPQHSSLRSMRVVMRTTVFEAALDFTALPTELELGLLAAAVLAWRRAGAGRNRGRGWLQAELEDSSTTGRYFQVFANEVLK